MGGRAALRAALFCAPPPPPCSSAGPADKSFACCWPAACSARPATHLMRGGRAAGMATRSSSSRPPRPCYLPALRGHPLASHPWQLTPTLPHPTPPHHPPQIGDSLAEFLVEATPDPKLRQLMMSMAEATRTIAFKVRYMGKEALQQSCMGSASSAAWGACRQDDPL